MKLFNGSLRKLCLRALICGPKPTLPYSQEDKDKQITRTLKVRAYQSQKKDGHQRVTKHGKRSGKGSQPVPVKGKRKIQVRLLGI